MGEDRVECPDCKTSYERLYLMGRQGNADVCPLCGAGLVAEDEHPDWITWYYYYNKKHDFSYLDDKMYDLKEKTDYELVQEFKAPPRDPSGSSQKAKEILRTYVPDAFEESPQPKVMCPRCFGTEIQMVPRKYSLLTGFATNQYDRVCVKCGKRF